MRRICTTLLVGAAMASAWGQVILNPGASRSGADGSSSAAPAGGAVMRSSQVPSPTPRPAPRGDWQRGSTEGAANVQAALRSVQNASEDIAREEGKAEPPVGAMAITGVVVVLLLTAGKIILDQKVKVPR